MFDLNRGTSIEIVKIHKHTSKELFSLVKININDLNKTITRNIL